MRMRQSIAEIEDQFFEEIEDDRERRENLRKRAERRAAERHAKRTHRHGSMRFFLLILRADRDRRDRHVRDVRDAVLRAQPQLSR